VALVTFGLLDEPRCGVLVVAGVAGQINPGVPQDRFQSPPHRVDRPPLMTSSWISISRSADRAPSMSFDRSI
jgi:hypothetical protein